MSGAVVLALVAGAVAAAGVAELAGALLRRRRDDERRALWPAALRRLARKGFVPAPPAALEARLRAAGAPASISARDAMAAKCATAGTAGVLGLAASAVTGGRLVVVAVVAAAAFFAPDLILRRHIRRRAAAIAGELADVLDLLRVCVEAGLPPGRALAEVGRHHGGLLARELRAVAERIELGTGRGAALAAMQARCPVEAVAALVAAIARSDRHGAPLACVLASLAADARAERSRSAREHAARAAPKIQLVVALLLVPATMLLVAAALVASLAGG